MAINDMRDLFLGGLHAIHNAERMQLEAYPQTMDTLEEPGAREGLQAHVGETKQHSERLEQILSNMGEEPVRFDNPIMRGIFDTGQRVVEESENRGVIDSGMIAAFQIGEHYEIATYGTLRTYAQALGMDEAAQLLQQTLDEEKAQDERLSEIAERVANPRANQ